MKSFFERIKAAVFLLTCSVVLASCSAQSKGYENIEELYRESVEVLKSKDKNKISDFISKIMPDEGTIAYLNKRNCGYRGIPKYINETPSVLDSIRLKYSAQLYNYALRLEAQNKLQSLKFEGFDGSLNTINLDESGCPEILFTEIFVLCTSDNGTVRYQFGELLKVDNKWKGFTNFKLG